MENASQYAASWDTAFDPEGLGGPFGLYTAEKRDPGFRGNEPCCFWRGSMWPFETSKAISALINIYNSGMAAQVPQASRDNFWKVMQDYTATHTWSYANSSSTQPYELTGLEGFWIGQEGDADGQAWTDSNLPEGFWYNHATFNDLIITGVVGIQPSVSAAGIQLLNINPMIPQGALDYFCLDGVSLGSRLVTVVWDSTGQHYGVGAGLLVYVDGVIKATSSTLTNLSVNLSESQ